MKYCTNGPVYLPSPKRKLPREELIYNAAKRPEVGAVKEQEYINGMSLNLILKRRHMYIQIIWMRLTS